MKESEQRMSAEKTGATEKTSGHEAKVDRTWKLLGVFAALSLGANILIVATGGAVRLTGSGLGCPTWPLCTPESLVPTGELSWHSFIEFGNRLMTGVLTLLAVIVAVLSYRVRHARKDLFVLSIIVIAGILLQAVLGGITVWTGLNSYLVSAHYLASIALVIVATIFLYRYKIPAGSERVLDVPLPFMILTHLTTFVFAATTLIGVLTTGAGPHSGDSSIIRSGFDATALAHYHSWPGYVLGALVLVLTVWAFVKGYRQRTIFMYLVVALAAQIIVGVYQARASLPPLAIGIHMVLAAICSALLVWAVMSLKSVKRAG